MRPQVLLPKVQPEEFQLPKRCPYVHCSGDTFKPHGRKGEAKAVRDTDHDEVTSTDTGAILWPYIPRLSNWRQSSATE